MALPYDPIPEIGTSPKEVWRLVDGALQAFGVTAARPDRATILEQGIKHELAALDMAIKRLEDLERPLIEEPSPSPSLERALDVELEIALLYSTRERLKFLKDCAGTLAAVVASEPPNIE